MVEPFDPYYKWFGIPPEEQPANHYRLLGVPLFVDDPEVISNAADRAMMMLRSIQTGKHSALSQKLLNEISQAKVCLLDPSRKTAYDAALRQSKLQNARPADRSAADTEPVAPLVGGPVPRPAAPRSPSGPPGDASDDLWQLLQFEAQPSPAIPARKQPAPRRRAQPFLYLAAGVVVLVGVIVSLLLRIEAESPQSIAAVPTAGTPAPPDAPTAKEPLTKELSTKELPTRQLPTSTASDPRPAQEKTAKPIADAVPLASTKHTIEPPPVSAPRSEPQQKTEPVDTSAKNQTDAGLKNQAAIESRKETEPAPPSQPEANSENETGANAKLGSDEDAKDQQTPDSPSAPPAAEEAGPSREFLFAPSPSHVTYTVPKGARSFAALGQCVEDRAGTFVVLANGRELYRGFQVRFAPVRVDLPRGTTVLELKVDRLADRKRNFSCWVSPRFYFSRAADCEIGSNKKHVKLTELQPTSQGASGGFKVNEAPENVHPVTFATFAKSLSRDANRPGNVRPGS